jgi:5'-nucleotidase
VTLGDILEILPFEDPVVVLELDGEAIWAALEASLETWPAQEGRFPVISGFHVSWDSRQPPGQRVLGVWLLQEGADNEHDHQDHDVGHPTQRIIDDPEIKRERGGRQYKIVTREYMAQGHDGFIPLKGKKYLVDDENGQLMSSLVRKYLLGSLFVNKMARLTDEYTNYLQTTTLDAVSRERAQRERAGVTSQATQHWQHAVNSIIHRNRSKVHYQDQLNVASTEHMSSVDCFDGESARAGKGTESGGNEIPNVAEDLITVSPVVDGRLKDIGRH